MTFPHFSVLGASLRKCPVGIHSCFVPKPGWALLQDSPTTRCTSPLLQCIPMALQLMLASHPSSLWRLVSWYSVWCRIFYFDLNIRSCQTADFWSDFFPSLQEKSCLGGSQCVRTRRTLAPCLSPLTFQTESRLTACSDVALYSTWPSPYSEHEDINVSGCCLKKKGEKSCLPKQGWHQSLKSVVMVDVTEYRLLLLELRTCWPLMFWQIDKGSGKVSPKWVF